jgi:hypothetical protein
LTIRPRLLFKGQSNNSKAVELFGYYLIMLFIQEGDSSIRGERSLSILLPERLNSFQSRLAPFLLPVYLNIPCTALRIKD